MPSFLSGTRLLTERGRVRVENLRLGDRLLTASHGSQPIKWIGRRSYSRPFIQSNPDTVPVCIKADALDHRLPSRDLLLSARHGVYVGDALIPAGQLVNDVSILRSVPTGDVNYYHVELSMHCLIYAEDMLVESYVDRGNRAMFLNAHELDEDRQRDLTAAWSSCAPVIQDGPKVQEAAAFYKLRAGILPEIERQELQTGPLVGHIEWADHTGISGWAWLPHNPRSSVMLELRTDDEILGCITADVMRDDLRRAGIGNGAHAFHLKFPVPLSRDVLHRITVVRAFDGAPLTGSPYALPTPSLIDRLRELDIGAIARTAKPEELRWLSSWLEQQSRIVQSAQDEVTTNGLATLWARPVPPIAEKRGAANAPRRRPLERTRIGREAV